MENSLLKVRSESDHATQLADEWSDIFFVMTCLANQLGIDTEAALQKTWRKKPIETKTDIREMKTEIGAKVNNRIYQYI